MPRGFTIHEMEIIREKLKQTGRVCMEQYGVRKTTVDDLTRAAGISKGAFYKFFNSKEELFFEVLEEFEKNYRIEIKNRMMNYADLDPKNQVRFLLKDAFTMFRKNPLFAMLNPQEYEVLIRKLPQDRVAAHLDQDDDFIAELLSLWRERELPVTEKADEVSALVKSLFYVSLHANEIGSGFPAAFDTLINLVADHLVGE